MKTEDGTVNGNGNEKASEPNEEQDQEKLEPITVPYLSPLVLRKELENMLETEGKLTVLEPETDNVIDTRFRYVIGDNCLSDPDCVDQHPIIYWNMVWFFERIGLKSHIPGLCLNATSLNYSLTSPSKTKRKRSLHSSWSQADHTNIFVACYWDNRRFYDECGLPLYQKKRLKSDKNINETVELIVESIGKQ